VVSTAQATAPETRSGRRPLSAQLMIVASATLFVAAATFVATRIYADRFGVEAVSALLVFRLGGSVLVAIATLGMPIALQRTVAFYDREQPRAASAAMIGLIIGGLCLGMACAAAGWFAQRLAAVMHHPGSERLWTAFVALTWTQGIATLLSCIDLGRGYATRSAITNALAFGAALLLPLALLPRAEFATVVYASSALAAVVCLPAMFDLIRWWLKTKKSSDGGSLREVMSYGVPRIAGNVLDPASDLLLPILALTMGGLRQAGYFAAGLALLRPLNPLVSSLNMVLIPDSARMAAVQQQEASRKRAAMIAQFAVHLGVFAAIALTMWADVVLVAWLGPSFADAGVHVRVLVVSILPALVYGSCRGIIDGQSHRAVNTGNLAIAFAVFALGALLALRLHWTAIAVGALFVASRVVLGGLTLQHLLHSHGLRWRDLRSKVLALAAVLVAAVLIASRARFGANLAAGAVSTFIAAVLFVFVMHRAKAAWVVEAARRFTR
jgi:O-antigen/teichoic acid export membrane protein